MNELRQFLGTLPHKGLLGGLLLAWVALFHLLGNSSFGYIDTPSMFVWLGALYDANPDDALGYFVLPLIAALIYRQRDEFMPLTKQPWAPALGLLGLAVSLHFAGFLIQQARVSLMGFCLGLYGLTGLFWGRDWMRKSAYPFALLVFAVPITAYTDGLTFHLRLLVTKIAAGFCTEVLHLSLIREGTTVFHLPPDGGKGFEFDVAPACSGIRSLTVVFLLAAVFGYLWLNAWWRRGILLAAALPLALLGNVTRLITVFVVGEARGSEAGLAIETKLGFVTFLVALGGVVLLARWLDDQPKVPAEISADPEVQS
jgi:exosortase